MKKILNLASASLAILFLMIFLVGCGGSTVNLPKKADWVAYGFADGQPFTTLPSGTLKSVGIGKESGSYMNIYWHDCTKADFDTMVNEIKTSTGSVKNSASYNDGKLFVFDEKLTLTYYLEQVPGQSAPAGELRICIKKS